MPLLKSEGNPNNISAEFSKTGRYDFLMKSYISTQGLILYSK